MAAMASEDGRFTRIAAYGLITAADRILLCRLSATVRTHRGYWTLPGGGLDFGETPVDAMIREVKEETGLDVVQDTLLDIDSICTPGRSGPMHSIRIVYRARVVGGALRPESDNSTDLCQWWPRDELARLPMVDLVQTFLPRAFEGR